jgi:hypothetical protein
MPANAQAIRLDPWAAEYEGSIQIGEDAAPVPVELGVEQARWVAIRPAPSNVSARLAFVDGVRRVEHRVLVEVGERTVFGLLGSFGVGAVRVADVAEVGHEALGRVFVTGGGLKPDPFVADVPGRTPLRFEPRGEPENDPAVPVRGLQKAMRQSEAGLAERLAATGSRGEGVQSFFWTVREVATERLLRFLFAEAEDASSQLGFVVDRIEAKLALAAQAKGDAKDAWIEVEGRRIDGFDALVEVLTGRDEDPERSLAELWAHPAAPGTVAAFERRLHAAAKHVAHLIRGRDVGRRDAHLLDWKRRQVSVVDIHALHDRAKRFVVGAVLKRMFEEKEGLGTSRPLVFVVLDELNKYAPREGGSPIKEVLLDISERGRSLGIVLLGAQQAASEVEGRIVQNAALRVVGRLDPAEAERAEYGFLTAAARGRASILKPGTMIVLQPEIPTPLLVRFPFPAWATRKSEVAEVAAADPFAGFREA